MNRLAEDDARGVEIAEQQAARCLDRVRRAALTLDRVLAERGARPGAGD